MCEAVYFLREGQEFRLFFAYPRATLPVRMRSGETVLLPWGRRQDQIGKLPLGGWARLDSIHAGRWDRWFPIPVKLPVAGFMEKDLEGRSRWYELTRGQCIQGLVACDKYEQRVYVVTLEPERDDALHTRWPKLLCG